MSLNLDNLDTSAQPFGDGYVDFDSAHPFASIPNFADSRSQSHSLYSPPAINTPIQGYALKLWTRQNAVRLEEKDLLEKQLLNQILEEADVYKTEFHKKREAACETNKVMNSEKEKVFLDGLKKFHVEADKDYWKSIAELVPKEMPVLEKKGKEKEKKPTISIMQGPKPGKPTDLSRMRQTLIKLKHDTPAHLKPLFHVASGATADDLQVDPVASSKAPDVEITQPIAVT